MPDFDVVFRGPGGVRQGTFPGADVADVQKHLKEAGFEPLGFAAPGASSTTTTPTTGQPGMGTNAASMAAQIGVPALMAAKMGVRNPLGLAATGIAAGLAPYLARGGALGGAPGAVQAGKEALPGVAAGEVPLGKLIPGGIRQGATEALQGSKLAQAAGRVVGPIYQRATERAGKLLLDAKGIMLGAEPLMQKTLKSTLDTFGVDVTKMTAPQLLGLIRTNPERAAAAFAAFEKASGRKIADPATIQRLWVSDVLHATAKGVKAGARNAPGLLVEPGGGVLLDGRAVADAWNGLTAEGQATFGRDGKQAFDGLVSSVAKLAKAPKGIRQLTVGGGDPTRIVATPYLAALERVLKAHPGAGILGGLGTAYEALHHPMVAGASLAAAGAVKIGKRASRAIMERVLSTPEGVRWLTQGIDLTAQGLPSVMIADTLSRTAMRSAPLLMSLGLAAPPQQGPQAAPHSLGFQTSGVQ